MESLLLTFKDGADRTAAYSPIEHLARIMRLSDWQQQPIVMLTTAFDVSLDETNRRFLVMAGFISHAARWAEFDVKWRARLKQDGLEYFHAQRFAQSSGIFKGWQDQQQRRKDLMASLVDLIQEHAYRKFAVIVQVDAIARFAKAQERQRQTMMAIAGTFIAAMVEYWRIQERYSYRPRFVFEDGDFGKGALMTAIKNATGHSPAFEYKRDDPAKGIVAFTPLQAADLLAFECKKVADDYGKQMPEDFQFRVPYQHLNRMAVQPQIFTIDSADKTATYLKVDRYFKEHPLGSEKKLCDD